MSMLELNNIVFYSMDKAIRSYRQFAQQRLKEHGFDITIDQWIVLRCILQNPDISQSGIAEMVFKDNASVTRMIALLVKGNYLKQKPIPTNRRRVKLTVTPLGIETLNRMEPIIQNNREKALKGISQEEIELVKKLMFQIADNAESAHSEQGAQ